MSGTTLEQVPFSATFLDRYEVHHLLGEGGMGAVYRGQHRMLQRPVAIKVLKSLEAHDAQRFLRESRILASLSHPGIVKVHDCCEDQGRPILVFEYVEGEDLAHRIERGGLGLSETLLLAATVADALAYAHESGIVHRDIKPENILLTRDGRPLVADFGLARPVAAGQTLTAQGVVMGTPDYMSPEQVDGSSMTPATDQYSLGLVIYRMVTGTLPFSGETVLDLVMDRLKRPVPSVRSIVPGLPVELDRCLARCLARQPSDRHPALTALAIELRRIESSPAVQKGKGLRSLPSGATTADGAETKATPAVAAQTVVAVRASMPPAGEQTVAPRKPRRTGPAVTLSVAPTETSGAKKTLGPALAISMLVGVTVASFVLGGRSPAVVPSPVVSPSARSVAPPAASPISLHPVEVLRSNIERANGMYWQRREMGHHTEDLSPFPANVLLNYGAMEPHLRDCLEGMSQLLDLGLRCQLRGPAWLDVAHSMERAMYILEDATDKQPHHLKKPRQIIDQLRAVSAQHRGAESRGAAIKDRYLRMTIRIEARLINEVVAKQPEISFSNDKWVARRLEKSREWLEITSEILRFSREWFPSADVTSHLLRLIDQAMREVSDVKVSTQASDRRKTALSLTLEIIDRCVPDARCWKTEGREERYVLPVARTLTRLLTTLEESKVGDPERATLVNAADALLGRFDPHEFDSTYTLEERREATHLVHELLPSVAQQLQIPLKNLAHFPFLPQKDGARDKRGYRLAVPAPLLKP